MNINEIKRIALELAISAKLEWDRNEEGFEISNVDKLLESAKKIETYLTERTTNE